MDSKKQRNMVEIRKRSLQGAVTKIYVAISLCAPEASVQAWLEQTQSFPKFLKLFAIEHFKNREDICIWEKGMCQIISDLAMQEMTPKEQKSREIFLPRQIVTWLADFLERTFAKPHMRWNSPLFAEAAVKPITDELNRLASQPLVQR